MIDGQLFAHAPHVTFAENMIITIIARSVRKEIKSRVKRFMATRLEYLQQTYYCTSISLFHLFLLAQTLNATDN